MATTAIRREAFIPCNPVENRLDRRKKETAGNSIISEWIIPASLSRVKPRRGPRRPQPNHNRGNVLSESSPTIFFVQTEQDRDLPPPEYATAGAAGMDLRAAVPAAEPLVIEPGAWTLVPTGLRVALPPGFEAQIRPRSGLAARYGLGILNGPGTIDEDYRGEIKVILFNFSKEPFTVERGERIAQMVIQRVERLPWRAVGELPDSHRGEGGFGHTGRS